MLVFREGLYFRFSVHISGVFTHIPVHKPKTLKDSKSLRNTLKSNYDKHTIQCVCFPSFLPLLCVFFFLQPWQQPVLKHHFQNQILSWTPPMALQSPLEVNNPNCSAEQLRPLTIWLWEDFLCPLSATLSVPWGFPRGCFCVFVCIVLAALPPWPSFSA